MRILLIVFALAALMIAGQKAFRAVGPPQGGLFAEKVRRITREAPAPETELTRADGGTATLADWRGEVAVVTMWATWCGICVREMPQLQALAERYEGRGLSVVTVSVDEAPAAEKVLAYLKSRGLDRLPPLIDVKQEMAVKLGLRGTPTTFIVDRFGQVTAAFEGLAPWEDEATHEYFEALMAAPDAVSSRGILAAPGV